MPGRLRDLTRRERQIMDVIWRRSRATAAEVREELPDPPSYSAVRAMLVKLERKGHVTHAQDGPRYVYLPVVPTEEARESALERLVSTFFGGSTLRTVAALLDRSTEELTAEELDRLERLIDRARKGGP
ncbi:MAG TPA: BlaI/MecI/CopY family transcriptional regulator [Longimicrobiales bacterium]|nr:BlaI/MecI/CopY family transcriptional regulator [Longimicrobiales bacterium]